MKIIQRERLISKNVTDEELLDALNSLKQYDYQIDINMILQLVEERKLPLEKKYFFRKNDTNVGPIDIVDFYGKAQNGIIKPDTYVWKKNFEDGEMPAEEVYWLNFEATDHIELRSGEPHTSLPKKTKFKLFLIIACTAVVIAIVIIIAMAANTSKVVSSLKNQYANEIEILKSEIETLKQTDQYYYASAIDALEKAIGTKAESDYEIALTLFGQLIDKFPNSQYVSQAQQQQESITMLLSDLKAINGALDSINQNIELGNFGLAEEVLILLKGKLSNEEYDSLSAKIYEAKNKPISVTLITLLGYVDDYYYVYVVK